MHLDPRFRVVPARNMTERGDGNRAIELAIDPMQQIQVEFRGHALRIVIRGNEDTLRFDSIDANEQLRAFTQCFPHRAQQVDRGRAGHVAYGGAREESEARSIADGWRQYQPVHEVAFYRVY